MQEMYRWWKLWKPDVREGWLLLSRWKVSRAAAEPHPAPRTRSTPSALLPGGRFKGGGTLQVVAASQRPQQHSCLVMMWVCMQRIVWGLLAHIKAQKPTPGSFAALLLAARDPATGRPLSDARMFPEIAALFFAGIDTTAHTGRGAARVHGPFPCFPTPDPRAFQWDVCGCVVLLTTVADSGRQHLI